jgi:hypothetical protein
MGKGIETGTANSASTDLPQRFANGHGRRQRDIEATAATLHRDQQPCIGTVADMVRDARRFTTEEQNVAIDIVEIAIGQGGVGRKQQQPALLVQAPFLEAVEVDMPGKGRHFEIVHAGALQVAVGEVEAGRLDDVDGDAEASGHAQDGAGISGNIGLVERDADVGLQVHHLPICGRRATAAAERRKSRLSPVANRDAQVYSRRCVNSNRWRGQWIS